MEPPISDSEVAQINANHAGMELADIQRAVQQQQQQLAALAIITKDLQTRLIKLENPKQDIWVPDRIPGKMIHDNRIPGKMIHDI